MNDRMKREVEHTKEDLRATKGCAGSNTLAGRLWNALSNLINCIELND